MDGITTGDTLVNWEHTNKSDWGHTKHADATIETVKMNRPMTGDTLCRLGTHIVDWGHTNKSDWGHNKHADADY